MPTLPENTAVPCLSTGPHAGAEIVAEQVKSRRQVRHFARSVAFTLVELLVVMAVIVVLIGMTVPVFKKLVGGRGMESSINSMTSLLELARATALANQTYVWVFVKNVTNSEKNWELRSVAVMSTTNQNSWYLPTLKPISKLLKLPNIKNTKYTLMPQAVKNVTPAELASDGTFIAGYYSSETGSGFNQDLIVDGENFRGATFIGFLRDGEVGTSNDYYRMMIETKACLGLIATNGSSLNSNASDGAIIAAYGPSGGIRVIRP